MRCYFDHERLEVYQIAIEFVAWSERLLESCRGKASSAKQHLEEASSSNANNIAEGNGKWSKRDRKKFMEVARGSARIGGGGKRGISQTVIPVKLQRKQAYVSPTRQVGPAGFEPATLGL